MYLSFDSIHVTYHPFRFKIGNHKIFDVIASSERNTSSSLEYLFEKIPIPVNNKRYDKVVFDCIGILFHRVYYGFEKKIKNIHNLLTPGGEFIVGANYQTPTFDGPFQDISAIDEKIERILDCGFELKERIYSENEYIVYKFNKK